MALKIEQVAIYTNEPRKLIDALSALGYDEWAKDEVLARGEVWGDKAANRASLAFNYQLGPFEFELLKYEAGTNWLGGQARTGPFLSHLGVHVEDVEPVKAKMKALGYRIAQEVTTLAHTNPVIAGKRQYRYVIFDTKEALGFYLKIIQRIKLSE